MTSKKKYYFFWQTLYLFCLKKFNIINVDKNHHKKLTNYKNVSITKKIFKNKVRYKYLVQELDYFL